MILWNLRILIIFNHLPWIGLILECYYISCFTVLMIHEFFITYFQYVKNKREKKIVNSPENSPENNIYTSKAVKKIR